MRKKTIILILTGIIFGFYLSGCVITKESPAPGCIEYVGVPIAGGCFGRTVILDIQVEPEIECLEARANNCNGGVFEIINDCDEEVFLEGFRIAPSSRITFDVAESEDGNFSFTEIWTNFSEYIPEEDTTVKMNGSMNDQEIMITFLKTKALCE